MNTTNNPETLCTGCGATVTQYHGFWRDSSGATFCHEEGSESHSVELPPVAIAPEPQKDREPCSRMTRAELFADSLWDDLGILHSNIEMTRGQWIIKVAMALNRFAEGYVKPMLPAGVGDYVHSREGCPFMYCDQQAPFAACKEKCRHA